MSNNKAGSSGPGRKPLHKCVDIKLIRDWVPENARRRIDLTRAWNIIRIHFCAAVVARGVCPIECVRCKDQIVDLFRLKRAENPERLLTWLAKDHSARWIEKLIEEHKQANNIPAQETRESAWDSLFPNREPTNLFEELLKDYEDQIE